MSSDATFSAADMDRLFAAPPLAPADAPGTRVTPGGERGLGWSQHFVLALHRVLQAEKPDAWPRVLTRCGGAHGRQIAAALDRELAAAGRPPLGELPLETCVTLFERHCAAHGWGRLTLDLADAPTHGLVVARLAHSFFVEALPPGDQFADPLLAGMLQGYFEHVSGQQLTCSEIGCARRGLPHCTFVIAAPEQLATVLPLIGRATPDAILAKLRS